MKAKSELLELEKKTNEEKKQTAPMFKDTAAEQHTQIITHIENNVAEYCLSEENLEQPHPNQKILALRNLFSECQRIEFQQKRSPSTYISIQPPPEQQKKSDIKQTYMAMPVSDYINVPMEIGKLLLDLKNGQLNTLFQDALNHATIQISLDDKDKGNKKVDINLQIAGTIVSKYAHLLKMVLKTKPEDSTNKDYHEDLEHKHNEIMFKFKQAKLRADVNLVLLELQEESPNHAQGFFSCFVRSSKDFKAIQKWLSEDLDKSMTHFNQLAGALYTIRLQTDQFSNNKERQAWETKLDRILAANDLPNANMTNPIVKEYIDSFNNTTTSRLPSSFHTIHFNSQQLPKVS